MKKECVTTLRYHELVALVKKTYGAATKYDFVAVEECGNDSVHRFEVAGKKVLDPNNALDQYDLARIKEIEAGLVPLYSNHVLFQDLVNRDVLEPGVYLVEVSW